MNAVRSRRNDNSGISYGERTVDESTQNIDQKAVIGIQLDDMSTVIVTWSVCQGRHNLNAS
jgi:hypothetical protein